jgi:hypothetical protein
MPFTCDASAFVALLLERGADRRRVTDAGHTALDIARLGQTMERHAHPAAPPQECKRFDLLIELLS